MPLVFKEICKNVATSIAAAELINFIIYDTFAPTISTAFIFSVFAMISFRLKETRKHAFGIVFLCSILFATTNWLLKTFPLKNAEQVVETLNMPLNGFIAPFVIDYCTAIFFPCFILSFFSIPLTKKLLSKFNHIAFVLLLLTITIIKNAFIIWEEIPINDYLYEFKTISKTNADGTQFFKDHYISADSIILKRDSVQNLILILAESLENFPQENIPQIYSLAKQGQTFYDSTGLYGGNDIPGALNTISATVAKTTGLPLFSVRNENLKKMVQNKIHLKKAQSIYNLLQKEGYTNVFVQGSDASFAGTEDFLYNHGINQVYDSKNINTMHDVNEKFWQDIKQKLPTFNPFSASISDKNLFEVSKKILDTLSNKDHFSLTIATIDTHYPYGFYNKNCNNKPIDNTEKNLYKAAIECSSNAIYDFVTWAQKRNFAGNTTIAIIGDHLFMGNLADSIHADSLKDRRWITIILNGSNKTNLSTRDFSSLDIAPTLIESIGFSIDKHKLGFGVSLYSGEPTLYEIFEKRRFYYKLKKLIFSKEYLNLY